MAKFLLVYGSIQGQSGKIATAMQAELVKNGHQADVWDVKVVPRSLPLDKYEAFIIGGGVHAAGYPSALRRWVRAHAKELSLKPGAFFSVCLGILQEDSKVQEDERKIVEAFFNKTNWRPGVSAIFPGALRYSKYNWLLKRVMRSIARRAGVDTDLRRDYEYTNWDKVNSFARQFAGATENR